MKPLAPTVRIAFLVLVHEHPEHCARLAGTLLDAGHTVVLHLDLDVPDGFRERFDAALGSSDHPGVHWCRRVAVTWGEWSMVEATLSGLETIAALESTPDHVYLLSGADYPLRPISDLEAFLARHPGVDFIEHRHARKEGWVQDGPQLDRFRVSHHFNWRRTPRLFSLSIALQRRLGRDRTLPDHLEPHLGAQWWVLSWSTCQLALEWGGRSDIRRFFQKTWVPDELFFQTLVGSLVPAERRQNRLLTHCMFSDRGLPLVFHDDHADYLSKQPAFFARKLSPRATALRDALDQRVRGGPTRVDDESIGTHTSDVARFLERHTRGIDGQFSYGRTGDQTLGALQRISAPWFVLAGRDTEALETLRLAMAREASLHCHGTLFGAGPIELTAPSAVSGVIPEDGHALRDQDPLAFLADVLRGTPGKHVGFVLDTREPASADLLRHFVRAPHCHVIHAGSPDDDKALYARLRTPGPSERGHPFRAQWLRVDPNGDAGRLAESMSGLIDGQASASESWRRAPGLILHIGLQRTGSTALQRFFHANRDALRDQGIHYPFDSVNHNDLVPALERGGRAARAALDRILAETGHPGTPQVLISAEDLARLSDPGVLAPLVDALPVRVICLLRRQDEWLESWYNQHLRWPWEPRSSRMSPTEFIERSGPFPWLDYRSLVERWSAVVGRDNLEIEVFETVRGDLAGRFCETVGIDPNGLQHSSRSNDSIPPLAADMLRHLGLFGRPVEDRKAVIGAVRKSCVERAWQGPSHAFSESVRLRWLERYIESNHWVARHVLGRDDGQLFPAPRPEAPGENEGLRLPAAADTLRGLLPNLMDSFGEGTGGNPAEETGADVAVPDSLLQLEVQRRRLLARRAEAKSLLASRRRMASSLLKPGRGIPPHDVSSPADGDAEISQTVLDALDLPSRDALPASTATLLTAWALDTTSKSDLPESSETLLRDWLSPLIDVLAGARAARRLLGGAELEDLVQARQRSLDRLRAEVEQLEGLTSSRWSLLTRLLGQV